MYMYCDKIHVIKHNYLHINSIIYLFFIKHVNQTLLILILLFSGCCIRLWSDCLLREPVYILDHWEHLSHDVSYLVKFYHLSINFIPSKFLY